MTVEPYGTLTVRAFTSRAQIPVPGATAAVTRPTGEGRHQLVALRVTDESGLIEPIPFPAPPPGQSERPGGGQPFALCDVWVEHPDFQMLHVADVQVFAGVETRQEAELLPLPEHPDRRDMTSAVTITPQPL